MFKLIKFIGQIFYLRKFYHWLKPGLTGFIILFLAVVFILYAHSEYISWIEISGRKIFLGYSYLLKNILIIISIIAFYIYAKGQQKKSPKTHIAALRFIASSKCSLSNSRLQAGLSKWRSDRANI